MCRIITITAPARRRMAAAAADHRQFAHFFFQTHAEFTPGRESKKMSMSGAIRRAIKVAAGVDWSIQGHKELASLSLF
jgi:hypothetical protein